MGLKTEYLVIAAAVALYLWHRQKQTGCTCGH